MITSFLITTLGALIGLLIANSIQLWAKSKIEELPPKKHPPKISEMPLMGPFRTASPVEGGSGLAPVKRSRILPPQDVCPRCGETEMEEFEVGKRCEGCHEEAVHYHIKCKCGVDWLEQVPEDYEDGVAP